MKPFKIPLALESIIDTYPAAEDIVKAINVGNKDTCYALARLWLSEGIPFCFKSQPAIYEGLRFWLSRQLEIQAKEITIIGSGRQGYCLSPDENLGRAFGEHSDMDLSVVSQSLFERLKITFNKWHADYTRGDVLPRNEKEKEYWEDNAKRVQII